MQSSLSLTASDINFYFEQMILILDISLLFYVKYGFLAQSGERIVSKLRHFKTDTSPEANINIYKDALCSHAHNSLISS